MASLTGSLSLLSSFDSCLRTRRAEKVFLVPFSSVHDYMYTFPHLIPTVYLPAAWSLSRAANAPLVLAASVLRGTSLIILAGLPATILYGGTSCWSSVVSTRLNPTKTLAFHHLSVNPLTFVTTLPAPTVEPFPILTPGKTTTLPPIQQSSSIQISFPNSGPFIPSRTSGSSGCPAA